MDRARNERGGLILRAFPSRPYPTRKTTHTPHSTPPYPTLPRRLHVLILLIVERYEPLPFVPLPKSDHMNERQPATSHFPSPKTATHQTILSKHSPPIPQAHRLPRRTRRRQRRNPRACTRVGRQARRPRGTTTTTTTHTNWQAHAKDTRRPVRSVVPRHPTKGSGKRAGTTARLSLYHCGSPIGTCRLAADRVPYGRGAAIQGGGSGARLRRGRRGPAEPKGRKGQFEATRRDGCGAYGRRGERVRRRAWGDRHGRGFSFSGLRRERSTGCDSRRSRASMKRRTRAAELSGSRRDDGGRGGRVQRGVGGSRVEVGQRSPDKPIGRAHNSR